VAAEAGYSTDSLRHYFANQRDLQEHVIGAVTDELPERVLPRAQRPRLSGSVVERIASILEEMLPLDDERREEYMLWAAVAEWERQNPPADGSRTWRDQRALHRQCIAALRGLETINDPALAALPHPDREVEVWAALTHTFVDGLASQLVNTPGEVSVDAARALLRALLAKVQIP
jgi:AcrR family transcriptional regulator